MNPNDSILEMIFLRVESMSIWKWFTVSSYKIDDSYWFIDDSCSSSRSKSHVAARSTLPALTVAVKGSLTRPLGDRRVEKTTTTTTSFATQRGKNVSVTAVTLTSSCLMIQMTQMTQNHKDHRRVTPRLIWVYNLSLLNVDWMFIEYMLII